MKYSLTKDWWRTGVIYQIYPRSFFSSANKEVGDLKGIDSKMPYLAELGVDTIWLSPFFKSPMKDYGYDVEDYCSVDPMFGDMSDFERLVNSAHASGLKVIIDQVYNHTSDLHEWFVESRASRDNPKADWYVWSDPKPDGSPPNNWLAIFGGSAWRWDTRRRQYYLHQFLVEQPDLNFNNPEVQDAVINAARFWLNKGVDGFRLDTAHCYLQDPQLRDNPPATEKAFNAIDSNPYFMQEHLYDIYYKHNLPFIEKLRSLTDQYDARMLLGEIGGDNQLDILSLYTQTKKRLHTSYVFAFLNTFDKARFNQVFAYLNESLQDGWPCWAFSNHDVERAANRGQPSPSHTDAYTRMLMTLLMTMRGTPCIYQGEELGLPEAEVPYEDLHDPFGKEFWPAYKGRDGCRTPMPWQKDAPYGGFSTHKPWLPVDAKHLPLAVDCQKKDEGSMLCFTQKLLGWRKNLGSILIGDMELLETPEEVVGFVRESDEERLRCIFNLSAQSKEVHSATEGEQIFLDALIDVRITDTVIHMPPYSVCLLKSKK